jgi:hypothetical protein
MVALVDAQAHRALPRELSARIGPSLDRHPPVLRLKTLRVRMRIDITTLRNGRLAEAWAISFLRALHEALGRPDGDGESLRRFASPAAYNAEMIAHLLGSGSPQAWQFPELATKARLPPAIAILEILLEAGPFLPELLDALSRMRKLDAALLLLDEVALERLIRAVAEQRDDRSTLTAVEVVAIARELASRGHPPAGGDAGRRQAVRLWLRLGRSLPLRGIWQGLRLVLRLLEEPALLSEKFAAATLPDGWPAWCEAVRQDLARDTPETTAPLLERLRRLTPTAVAARTGAAPVWLGSECAGMLLLLETIDRLGWWRPVHGSRMPPRFFQALVAGAGMRLLCDWQLGDPIEPAVALLAGLFEEPDRVGLAQLQAELPAAAQPLFPQAASCGEVLEVAADRLASAFAARIRGFRNAGRASVVRHLLRVPGRILIEETALRVVLAPRPWAVALHISGADDSLGELDWLGGRRVSFILEGL